MMILNLPRLNQGQIYTSDERRVGPPFVLVPNPNRTERALLQQLPWRLFPVRVKAKVEDSR